MKNRDYITTIGLEVHLQLSTRTKAFCGCLNRFGNQPNSCACPVCLGFPGSLPVLNEEYLNYAIKAALALNCNIAATMKFDRKNYFYPDLPKNYQISQYDLPLSTGGFVEIKTKDGAKKIGITRVHMEEDAGKLIHDEKRGLSLIDFNRSGTPLLEIVSEPEIASADEAYSYLLTLKAILEYLGVSDCNMQEGSLRCDANISVRPSGQKGLGAKVELKNMNTFKGIKAALEHEQTRQISLLSLGKKPLQETRLWNADRKITEPMRTKEEAHDYRYFPEPDLVPFKIDKALVEEARSRLPEMPEHRRSRFIKEYNISEYDASILVSDKAMADYFESCLKLYSRPKVVANWLIGDILKFLNAHNLEFKQLGTGPQALADMLKLIDRQVISGKIAKDVLEEMLSTKKSAEEVVRAKGLVQITDEKTLEKLAEEVIRENQKVVSDYLSGIDKALGFLVGQLMKKTRGQANPRLANEVLKKSLEKEKR